CLSFDGTLAAGVLGLYVSEDSRGGAASYGSRGRDKPMIAPLVLVIAFSALLQFFVSYCRSVIAASTGLDLSEQVREISGIESRRVRSDEFTRLLQLLRLCPEPGNDQFGIGAVHGYYGLLGLLGFFFRDFSAACAHPRFT